jgi:signal transduction histidine kinase
LYDRKGGPIGSLSIYSEAEFEGDKWRELGKFISEYASALVEYLLGLKVEAAARLSLDQHEIDNNILFSESRITKLDQQVMQMFPINAQIDRTRLANVRREFQTFTSDINEYLDQIRSIASYSRDRRRDVTVSSVYSQYSREEKPPPWTSLREIVNTCFQAVRERYNDSGVALRPDYSQLTYAIKAYPSDLRTIFTNLSSNAVKHSRASSSLLISAIDDHYTFTVHVRNIAPPMQEEDRIKIFDAEFRGDRAIRENTDGHGLGLFIARKICQEYQFDLSHNQDKRAGNGLVWHDFTVEIPAVDVKPEF